MDTHSETPSVPITKPRKPRRPRKQPPARPAAPPRPPALHQFFGLVILMGIVVAGYVASGDPEPIAYDIDTAIVEPRFDPWEREIIDGYIREAAARYGVSESLVRAVIEVESQFETRAVSRKGAQGLMQLMPLTASNYGVRNPFDARENIHGGVRELRRLIKRFDHNLPLALAAYNAGEYAVLRYRGVPPYRETRQYVARVIHRMKRDAARLRNAS